MRPSEASGLWWGDVDLDEGLAYIRRSRHLYEYGEPKTKTSLRTIELHPDTVRLLRAIQPLNVEPTTSVFVNTAGTPIEPKNFSEHWYRSFRALGIRPRGLYTTKDTCVTTAIKRGVKIGWLESQTGVSYATLKRHYGKWLRDESREDLRLFVGTDGDEICPRSGGSVPSASDRSSKTEDLEMRGGGLEPPRVLPH
jgi:integrase